MIQYKKKKKLVIQLFAIQQPAYKRLAMRYVHRGGAKE